LRLTFCHLVEVELSRYGASFRQSQERLAQGEPVKLHVQGWSYGIAEHLTKHGFLFCVDAHRDGKRFIVKADDLLTAFLSLERDVDPRLPEVLRYARIDVCLGREVEPVGNNRRRSKTAAQSD
jgi:hypothetical protein